MKLCLKCCNNDYEKFNNQFPTTIYYGISCDKCYNYLLIEHKFNEFLIMLENVLDETNGRKGSKDEYCIYCFSNKYDGKLGVIHDDNCIISQIRRKIGYRPV